jgi:hypothetical protein
MLKHECRVVAERRRGRGYSVAGRAIVAGKHGQMIWETKQIKRVKNTSLYELHPVLMESAG